MFEVGGKYANRIGDYTILEIDDPKMLVEYDDGKTAELNMGIQQRIWENILAEQEIHQSRPSKVKRRRAVTGTNHFIRPVGTLLVEQRAVRGFKEHVLERDVSTHKIKQGDRLIYYSIESKVFFAVVTITGVPAKPTKRDQLTEQQTDAAVLLFPVDIDARAIKVESAVAFDAVEFESRPDISQLLDDDDAYIKITEDEFELLTELLTEVSEEEAEAENADKDDDDGGFDD